MPSQFCALFFLKNNFFDSLLAIKPHSRKTPQDFYHQLLSNARAVPVNGGQSVRVDMDEIEGWLMQGKV